MFNVNKKLWSFNIGSLLAFSCVWLVSFGNTAPVPEILHPHPDFILDYYSGVVTALCALIVTGCAIVVMRKGFNIYASDHPFWLILPCICSIVLTSISAFEMLRTISFALIPMIIVLVMVTFSQRLAKVKLA